MKIKIHNEQIRQYSYDESFRILGVYMSLNLSWQEQFNKMKEKMTISIKKVIATEMNIHQAHIYFNMYILKSVYFGCRVI